MSVETLSRLVIEIYEGMEVVGACGRHVGTVEAFKDEQMRLTPIHPKAGADHYWVPRVWVRCVDEVIELDRDADQARREWQRVSDAEGVIA
jgi:hypothetical protein